MRDRFFFVLIVTYFSLLIEYNKGEVIRMGQTVYADVLFLINFSMDFLVFYICARLSRRRLDPLRSALGAAVGGAYGVAALFIPSDGILPILCDLVSLGVICMIAFYTKNERIRDLIGRCALFAGVSAILGGIMTALYSALNRSGLAALEGEAGDDISVWLFALLAAAGGAAAFAGGKRMRRLATAKQSDIVISFESNTVRLRAMTDTGNLLSDPLSGRGVALCELEAVSDVFPRELVEFWKCGDIGATASLPEKYAARLSYIPAKGALGGKSVLLAAISPDSLKLIGEAGEVETDVLVAPVPHKLSAGDSRALLPPGII